MKRESGTDSNLVMHTWHEPGDLGLKIVERQVGGAIVGCVMQGFKGSMSIKQGMVVDRVNGKDVSSVDFQDIQNQLHMMRRPMTVTFRSTKEHRVMDALHHQFMAADTDGSGALDREELTQVIHSFYRSGEPNPVTD